MCVKKKRPKICNVGSDYEIVYLFLCNASGKLIMYPMLHSFLCLFIRLPIYWPIYPSSFYATHHILIHRLPQGSLQRRRSAGTKECTRLSCIRIPRHKSLRKTHHVMLILCITPCYLLISCHFLRIPVPYKVLTV